MTDIVDAPTAQGNAIARFQRQLFIFNEAIHEATNKGLELNLIVALTGSQTDRPCIVGEAKVKL